MSDEKKSFFALTKGQRVSVPLLILWPILVYNVADFTTMYTLSLLLYLFLGAITGCIWPAMLALIGAMVGLSFDPAVNGGTEESQFWATIWRYGVGSGVGLLIGSLLHASGIRNPQIRLRVKRRTTAHLSR